MKNNKFLSIGSIVKLKKIDFDIMIIGFCVKAKDEEKIYDYLGCMYPVGLISKDEYLFFNHDDIDRVIYLGYTNELDKEYKSMLLKEMENK